MKIKSRPKKEVEKRKQKMNNSNFLYHFIAPSIKEGVLFFMFICFIISIHAQNNIHWLYLKQDDNVYLRTPVIMSNTNIQIPAYSNAITCVSDIIQKKDSFNFSLPIYENKMVLKKQTNDQLNGIWIKYSGIKQYQMPCTIVKMNTVPKTNLSLMKNFPPKMKLKIQSPNNKIYFASSTFSFYDNFIFPYLSGSIATPFGDLGNLNGFIQNDTLCLSVFNGSFATQLIGKIYYSNSKIDSIKGFIYYGNWDYENFTAVPVEKEQFNYEILLKEIFNNEKFILQHQWKDIDNKDIILQKDKAIIVLFMGTWCPNCADENKLFTDWYNKISDKVQIIAFSVERHQHKDKSLAILKKYRANLKIPYPIVLLSEKGNVLPFDIFPEIKKIPAFPTTVYFDKKHQPVKATIGFNGPATKDLYLQTQQEIQNNIQLITP